MTATNLTASISNIIYPVLNTTYGLNDQVDQASTVRLTIFDASNTYSFLPYQPVTITDSLEGVKFTGFTSKPIATKYDANNALAWTIDCIDNQFLPGKKTTNRIITNQYAGVAAALMANDYLSQDGVVANYAIRDDNSQSEFAQGTLSGTQATSNLGGDLELAPAGSQVTITENTTSVFNSGTLNGVTASNNTLAPTATSAIKLQGTESLTNDGNAYVYVQIFSGGSISIVSGRYLAYDIWIDPASPDIRAGVDIVFTDGTTLRDASQDYRYNDAQNIPPHPNQDLSGFANNTAWYHRRFLLDNFSGKTISYVSVALEGDKQGTYAAYFKNIYEVDGSNNIVNTFFSGSFNVNPPKQLGDSGYSNVSCKVVSTYDCSTANRVSPSYSIDVAKIAKSSFITQQATLPTNTNVQLEYSLDGGNSYITCTNNQALPDLLAGLSVASKSIQFRQTFQQLTGALPESKPILSSMQAIIYPSYTASKSDVALSATTASQWNAGTLTNTLVTGGVLSLLGLVRNFNPNTDLTGFVIFGGAGAGPGPTTIRQHCQRGTFWVEISTNTEGHSRYDTPGSWQNFRLECDLYIDGTSFRPSIMYRGTADSNYDANYAYAVEFNLNSVALQRGSNSSQATAGTRTQVASSSISIASASWHHVIVIANGSNHQVFVDDVQYINATDATYSAAGKFSFRASNASTTQGYEGQFNNFGVTVIGLSGTWVSPVQSLTAAGTYGGSVVSWEDVSIGNGTSILVESTTNGGSTWQTVTNGGSITSLTLGQSLSGVNLQLRVTLSTQSASSMPQIQYLVARVLGGFSSSGTRIAPFLSLGNALIAGSTLTSWVATTPAGTTVSVQTSLDGTSYSSATNGGSIAGINAQPTPALDTFDSNTSPNYTSTNVNGAFAAVWFWDTINSRLLGSNGGDGILRYDGISGKDMIVIADLDQADNSGLIARMVDTQNMYALYLYDSQATHGGSNYFILDAITSGPVYTTLAQGAITFPRGRHMRFVLSCIGTSITASMDGVQFASVTDSHVTASGKAGLDASQLLRCSNLSIQVQGDNLSGKVVYSKVTLTSTDPTATPQLTDLTVAALHPNIGLGTLIPTADYSNTYLVDNFNDLAKKSDYFQNIDQNLSFIFNARTALPAPWILQSSDQQLLIAGPLSVDYSADLYRNEMVLDGVVATGTKSESKIGDGKTTSWALGGVLIAPPTVYLNNQLKTIGIKGIDTGKDFYWTPGSNAIDQDASGTILQQTDTLLFQNYTFQEITSLTVDNTNLANTITQKMFAARMGRTIVTQTVLNQASAAHTTSGDFGDVDVSKCRRITVDVNITAVSGTTPAIQFFVERKGVDGIYYPLWQSSSINTGIAVSTTIGAFAAINQALGSMVRLRWTITGTTPSVTFSASIIGILDVQSANLGTVAVVEDVSSQSLTVAAATAYANGLLSRYGTQGRTITFKTWRRNPSLSIGQYLPVFLPEFNINDASMLITQIQTEQKISVQNGVPSQEYFQTVTCTENANLGSPWKLLASTVK